jgi:hypothetical protein
MIPTDSSTGKLQRPAENAEWNPAVIETVQPYDEEATETASKHYLGPALLFFIKEAQKTTKIHQSPMESYGSPMGV